MATKLTPTIQHPVFGDLPAPIVDGVPQTGARQALDVAMTEREFMALILSAAGLLGWMTYHTFDSRRSVAGFPDLTLVHPATGRLLFAELKTERGRLTGEQQRWIAALYRCGKTVYVWRPSMWEEIVEVLQ